MAVTISLLLIFGILLALVLRTSKSYGTAFLAAMFGFYLAGTGAAPTVNSLMTALAHALPN
ncbi:hypothetical protein [Streptomyces sp. NPDC051993]|uniref:hypothetical protein n=1 Tax=Streptomyces sp. NPDC051993 TaxID=3155286 RepID=UPI0034433125